MQWVLFKKIMRHIKNFFTLKFELWSLLYHQLNFTLITAFCPCNVKSPTYPKSIKVTCYSSYLECLPLFFGKLLILQDAPQFYLLWSHLWFTLLFLLLWLKNTLIISLFEYLLIFTIVTSYMYISTAGLCLAPCLAHSTLSVNIFCYRIITSSIIITHMYICISTCLCLSIIYTVRSHTRSLLNLKRATQDCKDSYL